MAAPTTPLRGLVLLGGHSTRMGTDKSLLPYAPPSISFAASEPTPLWFRNASLLLPLCPDGVCLSARQVQLPQLPHTLSDGMSVVLDEPGHDIGPAAGLLAAHAAHPDSTFLVLAVDFPLVTPSALTYLLQAHLSSTAPAPVTAYLHPEDGHPEPLMAVWTPDGLARLRYNVEAGKTGPCFTARQIWKDVNAPEGMVEGRGLVRPIDKRWLVNTNTPEQWREAMAALQSEGEAGARG